MSELRFIRRCRDLGFSIAETRALRLPPNQPTDVCAS